MKQPLALTLLLGTLLLVAIGWMQSAKAAGVTLRAQNTPEEAVQNLLRSVRERNWTKAQAQLANASKTLKLRRINDLTLDLGD